MHLPAGKIQLPKYVSPTKMTLRDYEVKRNQILVVRYVGGLGDILMHRMLFEDMKCAASGLKIHFACPKQYHPILEDHPFIDCLLDSTKIDTSQYMVYYNTSTACGRYEAILAPFSDLHRSDIWAKHCGLELKNHEMHIQLSEEEKSEGKRLIKKFGDKNIVCLCPNSAISSKNLNFEQISGLVKGLRARGMIPVGLHHEKINDLEKLCVPTISGISLRTWMSVIDQSDYVVSVDTAAFHCAGGLKKPLIGVFSWADGKVYGKYFDFILVQKHRDHGNWDCGPCYNHSACPKSKEISKPCITEISSEDILSGFDQLLKRYHSNMESIHSK